MSAIDLGVFEHLPSASPFLVTCFVFLVTVEFPRVPDAPSACHLHPHPANGYVSDYSWVEGKRTDRAIERSMSSSCLWEVAVSGLCDEEGGGLPDSAFIASFCSLVA